MYLPEPVREAIGRLQAAGFAAYAVGGCVRDARMGRSPGDYDLATAALPQETERVFAGEKRIETGIRHGTVTVLLGGMALEITTFRVDGTYSDSRRPDSVAFTPSLPEDLRRRDFTVNAMAYSPGEGYVDPFGGAEDIQNRVIRCVGDPEERFREDALRVLRALRFASVLEFQIEPATAAALRRQAPSLERVSPERVSAELTKLLLGPGARGVLLEYSDVLRAVLPELWPMVGFDQRNRHHIYDVWEHSAVTVENVPPDRVLRWAALLHDSGKPACFTLDEAGEGHFYGHPAESARIAEEVLRRLRFDNATRERIVTLVRQHDRQMEDTDPAVKRALSRLGEETYFQLLELKRGDNLAQSPEFRGRLELCHRLEARARALLAQGSCFSLRDLAVKGGDLLAAGMKPGPELGETLDWLLDAVLEGRCDNDKAALLALAKKEGRI